MLTTHRQGERLRQAMFFALLFVPIFGTMFILGVFTGRANNMQLPLVMGMAIVGVIGSLVVTGINWRIGLYGIMFFILWDRLLGFGETGNLNATKLAIALTLIYMLTAMLNRQLPRWWERLADPLPMLAIAFVIVSFASMAYMAHPEIAIEYLKRRINIAVLLILIMIAVTNREVFHRCILCFVVGGVLIAILTTTEAFTGKSILEVAGKVPDTMGRLNTTPVYGGTVRLIGPSGDPTFYSIAQSMPGVLLFGLLFYYRKWWQKTLIAVGLAFIVFNILGTGSRGGALSFVMGCGAVFLICPIKHKTTKLITMAAILIIAALVLILSNANVAVKRIADPTQAALVVDYRFAFWKMCWQMWEDHPWTGMGLRTWFSAYDWYRVVGSSGRAQLPLNSFMQMLQETGIQGVIVYVSIYIAAGVSAGCAALGTKDRRLKFEATAIFGVMFGYFIFAGTSNVLENELYFLTFGLCGAAYNVYRMERQGAGRTLGHDRLLDGHRQRDLRMLVARQNAIYPPGT